MEIDKNKIAVGIGIGSLGLLGLTYILKRKSSGLSDGLSDYYDNKNYGGRYNEYKYLKIAKMPSAYTKDTGDTIKSIYTSDADMDELKERIGEGETVTLNIPGLRGNEVSIGVDKLVEIVTQGCIEVGKKGSRLALLAYYKRGGWTAIAIVENNGKYILRAAHVMTEEGRSGLEENGFEVIGTASKMPPKGKELNDYMYWDINSYNKWKDKYGNR